jgi:hypothetical protein
MEDSKSKAKKILLALKGRKGFEVINEIDKDIMKEIIQEIVTIIED